MAGDRFIERAVTDEIMYELMTLSGREYVDMYAQKVKAQQAKADRRWPPSQPNHRLRLGDAAIPQVRWLAAVQATVAPLRSGQSPLRQLGRAGVRAETDARLRVANSVNSARTGASGSRSPAAASPRPRTRGRASGRWRCRSCA